MSEKRKEEWLSAFSRLSRKDRVVLVVAAIAGLSFVSLIAVYLVMCTPVLVKSAFPDDGLGKVAYSGGNSKPDSYDSLPYTIKLPGSSYALDIGGEELYVGEGGTSFQYSDNTILAVFYEPSGNKTSYVIENELPAYITGDGSISASYRRKVASEGYYTGSIVLDYEGGILQIGRVPYYVLSYRYGTAEGKDIIVMSATTSSSALSDDRRILLQMMNTLGIVSSSPSKNKSQNNSKRGSSDG